MIHKNTAATANEVWSVLNLLLKVSIAITPTTAASGGVYSGTPCVRSYPFQL